MKKVKVLNLLITGLLVFVMVLSWGQLKTYAAASNTTASKAVALRLGTKQTITFDNSFSDLYYKISIAKNGNYRMYIYSTYHKDSNEDFWMGVYKSANDAAKMKNIIDNESGLVNFENAYVDYEIFSLKKGTYYIRVQGWNKGHNTTGIKFEKETGQPNEKIAISSKDSKKSKYKITYVLNGGKNNASNPSSYTGSSIITLQNPNRTGYSFKGWYTNKSFKDGSKISYIKKGAKKDYTLYAKWAAKTYKIRFDGNGGKSSPTVKNIKYDSKYSLSKATRSGYAFRGWYTNKSGGTRVTSETKMKTARDHSLYAHWEKNVFNPADTILSLTGGKANIAGTIRGEYKTNAKYTSSNTNVVTVNDGVLTPRSVGAAYITIKSRKSDKAAWETQKIAVTINSNDLYKKINVRNLPGFAFKSASEARNKNKIYCPQGICVTKAYILISAYNTGGEESRIYAYDKNSYKYKGYFSTGTSAHVGGLAYDEDNGIVFVSNNKKIQYIAEKDLADLLRGKKSVEVRNIKPAAGVETPKEMQTSTLTWHDGRLWVVVCEKEKDDNEVTWKCDMRTITYIANKHYDDDANLQINVKATKYVDSEIYKGESINGIFFDPNDEHTLYLTSSTGRFKFSKLYRCRANLDNSCGNLKNIKTLPSMAEGITFLNNNMLILYESCSDRFQDQKLSSKFDLVLKKVPYPMNYLTVFNRKDL